MPFSSLGLIPALVRAVDKAGYAAPTAIQAAAIPAILRGSDVLGAAQTGSGKTAAYALPLLQALMAPVSGPRQVRALILVPTRELAAQVGQTVHALAKPLPIKLKISVLFGGACRSIEMMDLRGGADIVVATRAVADCAPNA